MTNFIRSEKLDKQYLPRHGQQGQRFVYDSLGETLDRGGKAFCKRLFSGSHSPALIVIHKSRQAKNAVIPAWMPESRPGTKAIILTIFPFALSEASPARVAWRCQETAMLFAV